VGGAPSEGCAPRPGSLGDPDEGPQVSRVLNAIEKEIHPLRHPWEDFHGTPRELHYGQAAARGVGVGQLAEDGRGHLEGRPGKGPGDGPAFLRDEKLGIGEDGLGLEAQGQGLSQQMRPLEEGVLAFTSPQSANILQLCILATDDHE
jgi:hypothetical protein